MKKLCAGLWLAVCAATVTAGQDDDFLAMRQAFSTGDATRVAAYAQRLKGHVLEPYGAYYQLRPQLTFALVNPEPIQMFVERYKDSPLSDRLKTEWLKALGKAEQWTLFAEVYPTMANPDVELICYSLQQRLSVSDVSTHTEGQ